MDSWALEIKAADDSSGARNFGGTYWLGGGGLRVRMGGDRIGGHSSKVRRAVDIAAGETFGGSLRRWGSCCFWDRHQRLYGTRRKWPEQNSQTPALDVLDLYGHNSYSCVCYREKVIRCYCLQAGTCSPQVTVRTGSLVMETRVHSPHRDASEPLIGLKISSISAGHNHSLFITDSGLLYGCGANSYGQLGSGDFDDRMLPVRIYHPDFIGDPVHRYEEEPELRTLSYRNESLDHFLVSKASSSPTWRLRGLSLSPPNNSSKLRSRQEKPNLESNSNKLMKKSG